MNLFQPPKRIVTQISQILADVPQYGGSVVYTPVYLITAGPNAGFYTFDTTSITIPSFFTVPAFGAISANPWGISWGENLGPTDMDAIVSLFTAGGGIHSGVFDPGQVQYTTGYNDQYSGISGQQTFAKSMAISTANKIADQSNIKANTNIQYIAIDTGRATRTEDLLLDGAGNSTSTASSILCPFAQSVSAVIPPYCNIVQAGSAFDTTLTSTVTSADTRFVESDSTFPVVLNYNINAQGITLGNQTSPMIGLSFCLPESPCAGSKEHNPIKIRRPRIFRNFIGKRINQQV